MIKVLHYVGPMDRGGMETLIMNLYRNIDRTKIQFDFAIHGDDPGDYAEEIESLGGNFHYFPAMRKNPLRYKRVWRKFWQEHKGEYKVFHFHTNSLANIFALEEAYKAKIPVRIIHSHSTYANKGRLQWLNTILNYINRKKLSYLATDLIACSENAANWLFRDSCNIPIKILKNGVDLKRFKYSENARQKVRNELRISNNDILIGHIGAFLPVKNHSYLLKIIKDTYEKENNIKAIFVGDGPLKQTLEKETKESGMDGIVKFLGTRADIPELLSAMDIFVFPSKYEGLPVSLIEVQATGLTSIISDVITDEVVLKSNMIKLSISDSSTRWAEKIIKLTNGENRIIGNESIIEAGFDIQNTTQKYLNIISK